jgi:hypothetical protein
MTEPIIELIAEEIRQRLESVDLVDSVVRPRRINTEPCGDRKITLTQGARTRNLALGYPSVRPVVAFNQVFVIAGELRPSETEDVSIDTLRNRFDSEIRKALSKDVDWYTFGGYAINSDIGVPRFVRSAESVSIQVDLLVQYRHPENADT